VVDNHIVDASSATTEQFPVSSPRPQPSRRRFWVRRILVLIVVLIIVFGGLFVWADRQLRRVDALADYPGRPAVTPGEDWLLVGSDSREGLSASDRRRLRTGSAEGRRTDTVMLLHLPVAGGTPTLLSLPRDSYVPIPGQGRNKLNTAYALGGPQLLARTVEGVSGIRIDHYMEIGFDGFVSVVDSVGGVRLCPASPIKDAKAGINIPAGCQTMGGATALGYVRARYFDPRGDLGRVERQREFLRALVNKATEVGTILNPFASFPVGSASLRAVAVGSDDGLVDTFRFGWSLRKVASGHATTMTVPIADPGFDPGGGIGSTVRWDRAKALAVFEALKSDQPVPRS
jgi:LCP family protein required for cell wall assembly